jgi:hypothetical protein
MNQQRQPSISSLQRERPAEAPHLTRNKTCSDCREPAVEAGDGQLLVCPKCYGVLWHRDWGAEERKRKAEAAAAAKAAREETMRLTREMNETRKVARARLQTPIALKAEDLIISPPTLGTPGLDDDDSR